MFAAGTPITLTATAAAGYKFVKWQGGSCNLANPCSFTMNATTNITALFSNAALQSGAIQSTNSNVFAVTQSVTAANAAIITANTGVVGYVDTLNSAMTANITAANVVIAGFESGVYGNANVGLYLQNYTGNITAGNVTVTGNIAYIMGNYQNWNSNVTTISSALDQLAERLKAAGF